MSIHSRVFNSNSPNGEFEADARRNDAGLSGPAFLQVHRGASDAARSVGRSGSGLRVEPLAATGDSRLFKSLYNDYVKPHYAESEDYAEFVTSSHFASEDYFGYFTKRKTIWSFYKEPLNHPIGFTVVTEKRGGSIKFGPSVLQRAYRGLGLGSDFRILVEGCYPYARKAYNTLPDTNLAALSYVLKAGYKVEAHLLDQYREGQGEFVVGKLFHEDVKSGSDRNFPRQDVTGILSVQRAGQIPLEKLHRIVSTLLSGSYDEIDEGFVNGILRACAGESVMLSHKTKQLFIATRSGTPIGLIVATPKRGGALKCSPIALRSRDSEAFVSLLHHAVNAFPQRHVRKLYMHVPDVDCWMLQQTKAYGFEAEGILRQPYREGVDMTVLGKTMKHR